MKSTMSSEFVWKGRSNPAIFAGTNPALTWSYSTKPLKSVRLASFPIKLSSQLFLNTNETDYCCTKPAWWLLIWTVISSHAKKKIFNSSRICLNINIFTLFTAEFYKFCHKELTSWGI
jgi:hypothetical protein